MTGKAQTETTENAARTHWEAEALELLQGALVKHGDAIALASSFSLEDVVVMDLLTRVRKDFRVFAIDTGRLPEDTLLCADTAADRFGIRIEWYFPRHEAVEKLIRERGTYSFRESLDNRHECCRIRKVEPLSRALAGLTGWITGLRRDQNVSRTRLEVAEVDPLHGGIMKYSPLAAWSAADVEAYTRRRGLPRNRLYSNGYRSIGCEPCTRAVQNGEDERAGRWWWENPEHKECGLHARH
jgi:phosphoadenosine phosphosulfate reductase